MTVGILLLAGGRSRRYGSDKRLAQLATGKTLLNTCIDTITRAELPLVVCLGRGDRVLAAELADRNICYQICPNSGSGMGNTLAEGVAAVPGCWHGLIIALGDMPFIQAATYRSVAAAVTPGNIVVPICSDVRGHPVGFGRAFFDDLGSLHGDRGAKDIVAAKAEVVVHIDVRDPGISIDVDSPGDLDRLLQEKV